MHFNVGFQMFTVLATALKNTTEFLQVNTEQSFNSVLYCENLKTIEVAKDTIISRDAVRGCGEFEIRTFD